MGELIQRRAAASPLPFSGERLTSEISGQVEIEHYHRYLLAREYCRGKDVLDVASGEGYGAAMLAQVARTVVGIEHDLATVIAARSAFPEANLRFEQGDARSMQLPDACIDVVVSFETLEHIAEQVQFLSELRRVLRPDGLLIISTPDRDAYSPIGIPPNLFHVKELTRNEFEELLRRFFPHVAICLQRPLIGSVILGSGTGAPPLCYERRSTDVIEGSNHLARAPYMIAWAASAVLPPLFDSVYVYRNDLDTDPQVRRDVEMKLHETKLKLHEAESRQQETSRLLEAADVQAIALDIHAKALETQIKERDAQAQALAEQLSIATERAARPLYHWFEEKSSALIEFFGRLTRPIRQALAFSSRNQGMQADESQHEQRVDETTWPPVDAQTIAIPSRPAPVVSIIIPTYGQIEMTLRCLASIAHHPSERAIEVLVVDDAYPGPEDSSRLSDVQGIRLIRNSSNMGFLLSCNEAARHARGQYLYFLNNDTLLNKTSIDALAAVLDEHEDVGMVGSKLLFPDGVLQEAGGIIWSDASGWNYGRGQDPGRPEFNFLRETDYCSGASVMVRRDLFDSLGGFEPALAPAYYEDVDLAFRLRERGLKVVYQPRSEVLHFEGMSHGTDVTTGVKAHQLVNQRWIVERWGSLLAKEHYRGGEHVLRARDRARFRKVILVIDHYVPEPDHDAGSRSMLGIVDCLLDAGWIVKFWPDNRTYSPAYTSPLEQRGVEVVDNRWPGELSSWLEANGEELDHILVSRPVIAERVLPHILGKTNATLSYYGHDLHFARMRREAQLTGNAELLHKATLMERLERRVWRHFDVVIYPSAEEADEVRKMQPGVPAFPIVPFSFDIWRDRSEAPAAATLLFVAGFAHPPNVNAARFLIDEILPRLENEVGRVDVVLAGSNPTDEVKGLASDRVRVTGYVTDDELNELYSRSRVAVVPLRFGAGVKGKVVEALSRGLPLVTTRIGSQGILGLADVASVHDDPVEIVAAIKRLLVDDNAWAAQSKAQLDFARTAFSKEAMQASVLAALKAGEDVWLGLDQTAAQ